MLSMIGISGIMSDFLLSWKAYMSNPDRFLIHEANNEIKQYFYRGDIPYFFLFSLVFVVLFVYYCIKLLEKRKKFIYINEFKFTIFLFIYSMSLTRVLAGATWFYDTITLVALSQMLSFMLLGALGCLALLAVRKEKVK